MFNVTELLLSAIFLWVVVLACALWVLHLMSLKEKDNDRYLDWSLEGVIPAFLAIITFLVGFLAAGVTGTLIETVMPHSQVWVLTVTFGAVLVLVVVPLIMPHVLSKRKVRVH